jgi:hypothetical protein
MDRILDELEPIRELVVLGSVPSSTLIIRASVSIDDFGLVVGILRANGFERSADRFVEGDSWIYSWVKGDLVLLLRMDDPAWMTVDGWRISAATAANV